MDAFVALEIPSNEELERLRNPLFCIWLGDLVITHLVLGSIDVDHLVNTPRATFLGQLVMITAYIGWHFLNYIKLTVTTILVIQTRMRNPEDMDNWVMCYLLLSNVFAALFFGLSGVALLMTIMGQDIDLLTKWALIFGLESICPMICGTIFEINALSGSANGDQE